MEFLSIVGVKPRGVRPCSCPIWVRVVGFTVVRSENERIGRNVAHRGAASKKVSNHQ